MGISTGIRKSPLCKIKFFPNSVTFSVYVRIILCSNLNSITLLKGEQKMERMIDEKELEKVSGGSNQESAQIQCPKCGGTIPLKKILFSSAKPGECTSCGYKISTKWL